MREKNQEREEEMRYFFLKNVWESWKIFTKINPIFELKVSKGNLGFLKTQNLSFLC